MKRISKVLLSALIAAAGVPQALNPADKAVPPKSRPYVPTCADYRTWYEQEKELIYDARHTQAQLSDLHVATYPDRRELSADELMTLIDKHRGELGIDSITRSIGARQSLDLGALLYPQYYKDFTLSSEDWRELQRRAKERLAQNGGRPMAIQDVIDHWKSIVAGHPPFGLKVRD